MKHLLPCLTMRSTTVRGVGRVRVASVPAADLIVPPFSASAEKIPLLKPAFRADGTVTAANASSISDGAAALLLLIIKAGPGSLSLDAALGHHLQATASNLCNLARWWPIALSPRPALPPSAPPCTPPARSGPPRAPRRGGGQPWQMRIP